MIKRFCEYEISSSGVFPWVQWIDTVEWGILSLFQWGKGSFIKEITHFACRCTLQCNFIKKNEKCY